MEFNAKNEKDNIVKFIKDYYEKYNLEGAVIGISGGKDSAVVAGLLTEAIGAKNIVGLTLPCHSVITDKNDAKLVSDYYGFKLSNFDLTAVFDEFKEQVKKTTEINDEDIIDSDINLKPRLRMAALYYFAAMESSIHKKGYLVVGTSNKCELYVGYFTKGGDSVHDISPIADFTVDEVIAIGETLNVPKQVLYKKPSDGLSNKTDEDKLGVTYKDIATYMENPLLVDKEVGQKIDALHKRNQHKFNIPTYRRDEEWKKIA